MIILVLVVLGVCFGSFINALVWRLHQQEAVRSKKAKAAYSITKGRSMCTTCRHELAAIDLIPVLSWLWLKGRCRYCKAPIADTPVPELITPMLFVVSYLYWPLAWNGQGRVLFGFWLMFLVGFIALAIYDLKWFLLPSRIIFPLMALASFQLFVHLTFYKGSFSVLTEAFGGFAVGGGIFYVLFQISGGTWIGGGDVKLGWLLGVLLGGPAMSLLMIFVASLLGTVVSLPLLVVGKAGRKTHLPFGPFLLASAVIVRLFGAGLIAWYKRQLGV